MPFIPASTFRSLPTRGAGRTGGSVAICLALALTGCTGHKSAASSAPTTVQPLHTAALSRLGATRPPTTLPPATGTTAQTLTALAATQPPAVATGGVDQDGVRAALAFTARLVNATRADPGHVCGPRSADPAARVATPHLRGLLAGKGGPDYRRHIEPTIGSVLRKDDCGPLRWVGPGVVLGPQTWTVKPGTNGAALDIAWTGSFGYPLADTTGSPEPWGASQNRATYQFTRTGSGGWRLFGWQDAQSRVLGVWPHDVPLPAGYLPVPPAPTGDPAALMALHDAATAWRAAPGVTATIDAAPDVVGTAITGTTGNSNTKVARLTGTQTVAPARGDSTGQLTVDAGKTQIRYVYLDGGRRSLQRSTGRPTPKPGRTLPAHVEWTSSDTTERENGGASADGNPFTLLSLFDTASAAATSGCPANTQKATGTVRCYTAVLITGGSHGPLATRFTDDQYRSGRPFLTFTVGLDAQGRPAFLRVHETVRVLGTDYSGLTQTTVFIDYRTSPPPSVPVPDPATVADGDDIQS